MDQTTADKLRYHLTEALKLLPSQPQLVPSEVNTQPTTTGSQTSPQPSSGGVAPMSWGKRLSLPARKFITQMAVDFGCTPSDYMDCIAFETMETFSPSIRPRRKDGTLISSAVGLIQIMDAPAREIGLKDSDDLEKMTVEEQLPWVWKYFRMQIKRFGKPQSLEDLYMLIHWPAAVRKGLDQQLYAAGSREYLANKGLDLNADGIITKREAGVLVRKKAAKGRLPENFG